MNSRINVASRHRKFRALRSLHFTGISVRILSRAVRYGAFISNIFCLHICDSRTLQPFSHFRPRTCTAPVLLYGTGGHVATVLLRRCGRIARNSSGADPCSNQRQQQCAAWGLGYVRTGRNLRTAWKFKIGRQTGAPPREHAGCCSANIGTAFRFVHFNAISTLLLRLFLIARHSAPYRYVLWF